MKPEDSSQCSKQSNNCFDPSQVHHGQNLRYYFLKHNCSIIFPSALRSYKWAPSFKFPNQKALCLSLLLVCDTRFPLFIFIHLINFWSAAKFMKIFIKQIFPSPLHFLRVRSKYLPQHPILEYLQPVFVRLHRKPRFTTICSIRGNWIYLIKRTSKYYV